MKSFRIKSRFVRDFVNKVSGTLRDHRLLPKGSRILIALSGGQDSLSLTETLRALQNRNKDCQWHSLALAHCDHGWPLDKGLSDFVLTYATSIGLPLYIASGEAPPTEAGARDWRYAALTSIAVRNEFSHVAVAHTLSDAAETTLLNLCMGSGSFGIGALKLSRSLCENVQIVRPLLHDICRDDTERFCRENGLAVWKDLYNEDEKFLRNRIRKFVLPEMKSKLRKDVECALARTARIATEEAHVVGEIAKKVERDAVIVEGDEIKIRRECLNMTYVAAQRCVLRNILEVMQIRPTFAHVEALRELLVKRPGEKAHSLPNGIVAQVDRHGEFILLSALAQAKEIGLRKQMKNETLFEFDIELHDAHCRAEDTRSVDNAGFTIPLPEAAAVSSNG